MKEKGKVENAFPLFFTIKGIKGISLLAIVSLRNGDLEASIFTCNFYYILKFGIG